MKNKRITKLLMLSMLLFLSDLAHSQSVTFSITTSSAGGSYSPSHVFAVWITNSSGTYINTLERKAVTRISSIPLWVSKATGGTTNTDGITGATINAFSTHTYTWNCKDKSGNIVPDGNYTFWVEYSDGTHKYATYVFTKGPNNQTVTTQTVVASNLKNGTLVYTAPVSAVQEADKSNSFNFYYDSKAGRLKIAYDEGLHPNPTINLYTLTGMSFPYYIISSGDGYIEIDTQHLKGNFILLFKDKKDQEYSKKLLFY